MSLVYEVPGWALLNWERFVKTSQDAQQVMQEGIRKHPEFAGFAVEIFHRLFSVDPKPLKKTRPESRWAVELHDRLSLLPEFISMQSRCRADKFSSGTMTVEFLRKLLEDLPDYDPASPTPEELREQVKNLQELLSKLTNPSQRAALQETIEDLKQQGKSAIEAAKKYSDKVANVDGSKLQQACDQAIEESKNTEKMLSDFGFSEDGLGGNSESTSISEKVAAAQAIRLSPRLKEVAQEAGRIKETIAIPKRREKTKTGKSEIIDLEGGNEIPKVVPSQLWMLDDADFGILFEQRFASQNLTQYKLGGTTPKSKGPIILCIDNSGSMRGIQEIWSKAIALNLCSIAKEEKRDATVIHFNGRGKFTRHNFPYQETSPAELLDCMGRYTGGGTDWVTPLEEAIKTIKENRNFQKADIVFITDGDCYVSPDWVSKYQKIKQELSFTTYGILIGPLRPDELNKVSDRVFQLREVGEGNDEAIADLFQI